LRRLLWPGHALDELVFEQGEILADGARQAVLVAARPDGTLAGFIELAMRPWAEGCTSRPVGYVEGWYVRPEHRRSGVGRALMEAAERWSAAHGSAELASDAELANTLSQAAHRALGFEEVERTVAFAKRLKP
jgi:aminoglycoside 6'-N-acetyltransferase I